MGVQGRRSCWVYDRRDRHRAPALPSSIPTPPSLRSRRLPARLLAVVLSLALAGAPPATFAQVDNLPRLGDAGAEELSPAAERRLGEAIMRDPDFIRGKYDTSFVGKIIESGVARLRR